MSDWTYDLWCIPTADPGDVSGLRSRLAHVPEYEVLAIMGKTEGNGCVNDFSRTLAATAYGALFADTDKRPLLIMSGGTAGVLSPHVTAFVRRPRRSDDRPGPALACGAARTPDIPKAELGRMGQVEAVGRAVLDAMADAGIEQPRDVHFVQIKCPLLTDADVVAARQAGVALATDDTYLSMAYSRAASALGVAVALGEIDAAALTDDDICENWALSSSVASISSGAELLDCEILLMGVSTQVAGPLTVAHEVMENPIDAAAVVRMLESVGAGFPMTDTGRKRIRQIFAKADPAGTVRGRRTTMLNDSDIHSTRHARAAVGGVIAGITGEPMIYVSGGAEHQGPSGGGPIAVVAERSA
ncbi:ring-opening amidohydrolase [Acidihalobacter ferrooxydans]|uniref:Cyanuric acid amidohydrolase n=1 Tax=Acidihalobacter ferrooxydans TaxID=1765967 RepID=A0A1P8UE82_9GAMM|nr:ring-opening amidohydrolase [Acidihalobacter ferrooxydans]APZ42172.1 hypothetical protein BW247_02915 [Acidihalobacter ferrooxydans]